MALMIKGSDTPANIPPMDTGYNIRPMATVDSLYTTIAALVDRAAPQHDLWRLRVGQHLEQMPKWQIVHDPGKLLVRLHSRQPPLTALCP